MMRELRPGEEMFSAYAIGVRYICEHCKEGEMRACPDKDGIQKFNETGLCKHLCTKCNGELLLPRGYPIIEWVPINSIEDLRDYLKSDAIQLFTKESMELSMDLLFSKLDLRYQRLDKDVVSHE